MATAQKDRRLGVITAKYISTLQGLCTTTKATNKDITDIFNELRRTLDTGASTDSASSSSSRGPKGRRGGSAPQGGSGDRESFDRPCTLQPGEKQCWLVSELEPWNRVLCRNCIEFREHAWGEMTLQGSNWPESSTPEVRDILRASLLVHMILRQHRRVVHVTYLGSCVTRVLMHHATTFLEMAIFWHALQNGGGGVRFVDFTGSQIEEPTTAEDNDAAAFLDYLARNQTVASLELPEDFVMAREGEALALVLRNHVALESLEGNLRAGGRVNDPVRLSLTLHRRIGYLPNLPHAFIALFRRQISGTEQHTPSAVLRAALQSSSLKSLTVRFFTINAEDIEAMAAALTRLPPPYAIVTSAAESPARCPPAAKRTSCLERLDFFGCTSREPRLQRAYASLIAGKNFTLSSRHNSLKG
ncbi:hypothetical protein V5799_026371 [Amblyomma americanum]|uniref:Uncharacterized protein n=1 Tax=Amblyomma americanum TaxID=6943 RepID=A0AAQ4DIS2_AMBAM